MFDSLFKKSFNSAKCKTLLQLAIARIKLLRNKRDAQLKQLKGELAKQLETNQEPIAYIRVEHIYREQNIMTAYDVILLFCELLTAQLSIIQSQRHCPIDLREAVASIIFAAPQCSDIPELQKIRNLFTTKYGKEFTAIAAELRSDCCVNRVVAKKLSVKGPSIDVKLKLMKDIAMDQGLDWDPKDLASQNLRSPEDLLQQGNVVSGAKTLQTPETPKTLEDELSIPFAQPIVENKFSSLGSQSKTLQQQTRSLSHALFANDSSHGLSATFSHKYDEDKDLHALGRRCLKGVAANIHLAHKYDEDEDSQHVFDRRTSLKSVAAAAKFAENAAAAARAAALLASEKLERDIEGLSSDSDSDKDGDEVSQVRERFEDNNTNFSKTRSFPTVGVAPIFDTDEWDDPAADGTSQSRPPERPPPPLPAAKRPTLTKSSTFVHPKLPDYDTLTAYFQSLKVTRSKEMGLSKV